MKQLLIRGHLGLGDHMVANAIVRYKAKDRDVFVLCKQHNAQSLNFMWRDLRNVETLSVKDDDEANEFMEICRKHGHEVLGLGAYGDRPYDKYRWDIEFYRQAGLEFQMRWNGFVVHRHPARELQNRPDNFVLVHDDPSRNYRIDPSRLPRDRQIVRIEPGLTECLFDWWGYMEEATEIHMIDSSPAILVDSLPMVRAERLVMHDYARPDGIPPRWVKNWIHLK